MSMFGRKTYRAGPLRLTLSRSGVSTSIGGRRVRARVGSNGRRATSVNLAKGLRWTKSYGR